MRRVLGALVVLGLSAGPAAAQEIKIPIDIDKLAAKAIDTVNVTVDGALLQLASKFLSADDPDQKAAKALISKLKGIYVRNLVFANPGEYADADLDGLRRQLKSPAWTPMANVRSTSSGENVDVFIRMEKDQIAGLVVIAAQPKNLTIVNIVGTIDLDQLASLGGHFGIPKIEGPKKDE
jgi:hypothetical protein